MNEATVPPVVLRYLAAAAAGNIRELAECFTAEGTVRDEGRTYRGRAEIIGWREALASQWTFTTSVTGTEALDENTYRVSVHVAGDFPGGVADLTYHFSLREDLITELSIA